MQVDGVYLMSGGRLKMANKTFTSIKHDYEINVRSHRESDCV